MSSSWRNLSRFLSIIVTCAPKPTAIFAASVPTIPPPIMTTFAAGTPGTPPNKMPRPPFIFSKYVAPTCTDILPATSDIGVSNGKRPCLSVIVSYATPVTLRSIICLVNSSSGARCKYVKSNWFSRIRGYSGAIGSLTLTIISPVCQTSSAVSSIVAPALTYCSSEKPEPSPADFCTKSSCPASFNACTPAGVNPTLYSLSLISFGNPIFIC